MTSNLQLLWKLLPHERSQEADHVLVLEPEKHHHYHPYGHHHHCGHQHHEHHHQHNYHLYISNLCASTNGVNPQRSRTAGLTWENMVEIQWKEKLFVFIVRSP